MAFGRVPPFSLPLILLAALNFPGCSTPGASPREGLIVYHEPTAASETSRGARRQPFTRVFATGDREVAEDSGLQTYSGTIKGSGDTRSSSDEESRFIAERIFDAARHKTTSILTPERFGELWGRLEAAGILELPAYRADELPRDEAYFLLESGKFRKVVTRPSVRLNMKDEVGLRSLERWLKARAELLSFLNEL